MKLEDKIKELEKEAQEINVQLQNGEQQRQQLTGELLKKIGGIEALKAVLPKDSVDEFNN